jgi:hypothetical protein
MGVTWAGVRERVLTLREAPRWWAVFGAEHGHCFELLPVLNGEQVRAVERRLGTELPEEYRAFLLEVGAGGAGPDYGLFPIRPPERTAAGSPTLCTASEDTTASNGSSTSWTHEGSRRSQCRYATRCPNSALLSGRSDEVDPLLDVLG